MPTRYPVRTRGKATAILATLTSTPLPSLKDLKPLSNPASGIAVVPGVSSKSGESAESKRPKMDEIVKKPPFIEMVREAIKASGEQRKGASVQSIKKYIIGHYNYENDSRLNTNIKKALMKGLEEGRLQRPKSAAAQTGARGFFTVIKTPSKSTPKRKTNATYVKPKLNPKIPKESENLPDSGAHKPKQTRPAKQTTKEAPDTTKPKKATGKKGTERSTKAPKTNDTEAKSKIQPKKTKRVKNTRRKAESAVESDSDQTLKAAAPPVATVGRKLVLSPVSDSEVTLVKPNLSYSDDVIRMNYSDTELSIVREPTATKALQAAGDSPSRQPKARGEKRSVNKRLSLKTSRLQRKKPDSTTFNVAGKKHQKRVKKNASESLKTPDGSIEVNKTRTKRTKNTTKDMSADSIIRPRRMLRRKSSV